MGSPRSRYEPVAASYPGQLGWSGTFGSPVFANWIQYWRIARAKASPDLFLGTPAVSNNRVRSLPWNAPQRAPPVDNIANIMRSIYRNVVGNTEDQGVAQTGASPSNCCSGVEAVEDPSRHTGPIQISSFHPFRKTAHNLFSLT